jgi:hypothetical protein
VTRRIVSPPQKDEIFSQFITPPAEFQKFKEMTNDQKHAYANELLAAGDQEVISFLQPIFGLTRTAAKVFLVYGPIIEKLRDHYSRPGRPVEGQVTWAEIVRRLKLGVGLRRVQQLLREPSGIGKLKAEHRRISEMARSADEKFIQQIDNSPLLEAGLLAPDFSLAQLLEEVKAQCRKATEQINNLFPDENVEQRLKSILRKLDFVYEFLRTQEKVVIYHVNLAKKIARTIAATKGHAEPKVEGESTPSSSSEESENVA